MKSDNMVLECRTCAAYLASPDPTVGECRRRAPVPLVMHWPERPDLNEHGSVAGYRLTVWPGVNATDACMEYTPGRELAMQIAAQHEAAGVGKLNELVLRMSQRP